MPATLETILRVASVVNNPNTLKSWLAAWRCWHIHLCQQWVGDKEPLLRKLREGMQKLAPPPRERGRLRLHWWVRVLKAAASSRAVEFGAACNLAYIFALRVPSELLQQFSRSRIEVTGTKLTYFDVQRKGKRFPSRLVRWCVCSKSMLLCWHWCLEALLN